MEDRLLFITRSYSCFHKSNRFSFGFVAETAEGANGFCEAAASMTRNGSVQFLGSSREKRRGKNDFFFGILGRKILSSHERNGTLRRRRGGGG